MTSVFILVPSLSCDIHSHIKYMLRFHIFFHSFLFMYLLLNLCYFVSAHCCPSFVVYMHSFFWLIVLLSGSKLHVGIVYSLMEYTGCTSVLSFRNFSIFFTKQGLIETLCMSFNSRSTGHSTF